jgi:hypothetical protein
MRPDWMRVPGMIPTNAIKAVPRFCNDSNPGKSFTSAVLKMTAQESAAVRVGVCFRAPTTEKSGKRSKLDTDDAE